MNAQLKKGALELCVLAMLSRKDCYGFELVSSISQSVAMAEGTVYPLLKRLRDDDLLTTYITESSEGPPRKYYQITKCGKGRYLDMLDEWRTFCRGVDDIIEGRNHA